MTRQILATSGGFLPRVNSGGARPGGLIKRALELTGVERPRITLVMTASGDDPGYLSLMYSSLVELNCVIYHLALFPMPNHATEEIISKSDVIWVGGGPVVSVVGVPLWGYVRRSRRCVMFVVLSHVFDSDVHGVSAVFPGRGFQCSVGLGQC